MLNDSFNARHEKLLKSKLKNWIRVLESLSQLFLVYANLLILKNTLNEPNLQCSTFNEKLNKEDCEKKLSANSLVLLKLV